VKLGDASPQKPPSREGEGRLAAAVRMRDSGLEYLENRSAHRAVLTGSDCERHEGRKPTVQGRGACTRSGSEQPRARGKRGPGTQRKKHYWRVLGRHEGHGGASVGIEFSEDPRVLAEVLLERSDSILVTEMIRQKLRGLGDIDIIKILE
jgi:hypothetical protein